ncbi:MAG: hypothetical protein CMK43_02545, partial [Porticoccaceae bacterium]|nr:hypothetical protein [Porticoccaceae bacterium]
RQNNKSRHPKKRSFYGHDPKPCKKLKSDDGKKKVSQENARKVHHKRVLRPGRLREMAWDKKKPPLGFAVTAMATEKPMFLTAIACRAAIPIADKAMSSRSIIAR